MSQQQQELLSKVLFAGAFKNIHEADIRAFVCNKKEMDTDAADVTRTVANPPQPEEANFTSPGLLDTKLRLKRRLQF